MTSKEGDDDDDDYGSVVMIQLIITKQGGWLASPRAEVGMRWHSELDKHHFQFSMMIRIRFRPLRTICSQTCPKIPDGYVPENF